MKKPMIIVPTPAASPHRAQRRAPTRCAGFEAGQQSGLTLAMRSGGTAEWPDPCKISPMPRERKITIGEMRETTRLIVYCGDHRCAHSITMDPDLWPDNVRLSDMEERFVCTACGHRGADVRPLFEQSNMGTGGANFVPISFRLLSK